MSLGEVVVVQIDLNGGRNRSPHTVPLIEVCHCLVSRRAHNMKWVSAVFAEALLK